MPLTLLACGFFPQLFRLNLGVAAVMPVVLISITGMFVYTLGCFFKEKQWFKDHIEKMKQVQKNMTTNIPLTLFSNAATEDILFVFPLLFIPQGIFTIPAILLSTIAFVLIHPQYKNWIAKVQVALYIPLAYLVAQKYGMLTNMLGHSLTDLVMVGLILMRLRKEGKEGAYEDDVELEDLIEDVSKVRSEVLSEKELGQAIMEKLEKGEFLQVKLPDPQET